MAVFLHFIAAVYNISNNWKVSCHFVQDLQDTTGVQVYFIPGNHDYWSQNTEEPQLYDQIDTWSIYRKLSKHPQCLLEKSIWLSDQLVLVGHSGWYNHAYKGSKDNGNIFTEQELEKGEYNERTWQDKIFVNWKMSDRDTSKIMTNKVRNQLERLKNDFTKSFEKEELQVILVTHMVTIPEFCVPMPHQEFDYFNAFIGTDDFDELIKDHPILYNFMGHVHYRSELIVGGDFIYC
nr:metallophosphoesterase [Alloiococcus otitis]